MEKITEMVKKYDPQDQFSVLKNSYQQIEKTWNVKIDLKNLSKKKFSSIIVSGLGGSAIGGDLLQNFLQAELKVPLFVNRNYTLPAFVDENTLLIASSYSGNTEETLSALNQALSCGASIICVGSGGKTAEIAAQKNLPFVKIEGGLQPRFAVYSSFFAVLKTLQEAGIIGNQDKIVASIASLIKKKSEEFTAENNKALEIAESLIGYIPVVYSAADSTSAVGYRLKGQFNENSKMHSFSNVIPELNHNEIIGWETLTEKNFRCKLITILDDTYHPQIKRRFEITSKLAQEAGAEVIVLKSAEKEFKARLFDLVYYGDWISYYLAIVRGVDPILIKNINILKKELAQ